MTSLASVVDRGLAAPPGSRLRRGVPLLDRVRSYGSRDERNRPPTSKLTRSDRGPDLRLITRIGWVVIAAQFIGMVGWSHLLYSRFALTFDYSQYHQAWYLIADGDLNPYDSPHGFYFLSNDSELILYPLAIFGRLPGADQLFSFFRIWPLP